MYRTSLPELLPDLHLDTTKCINPGMSCQAPTTCPGCPKLSPAGSPMCLPPYRFYPPNPIPVLLGQPCLSTAPALGPSSTESPLSPH